MALTHISFVVIELCCVEVLTMVLHVSGLRMLEMLQMRLQWPNAPCSAEHVAWISTGAVQNSSNHKCKEFRQFAIIDNSY